MLVPATWLGDRSLATLSEAKAVVDRRDIEWLECEEWDQFLAALERAPVGVVALAGGDGTTQERLQMLGDLVSPRVVLIGSCQTRWPVPDRFYTVPASRHGLVHELSLTLYRARASTFLDGQARRVEQAPHITGRMMRLVEGGLLAEPPLKSVDILGAPIRRGAQVVRYVWRTEAYASTPKRFLQWVLTARAVLGRAPGASWEKVAASLGANRARLERSARGVLGVSLDEAGAERGRTAAGEFGDYLTDCLGLEGGGSAHPVLPLWTQADGKGDTDGERDRRKRISFIGNGAPSSKPETESPLRSGP